VEPTVSQHTLAIQNSDYSADFQTLGLRVGYSPSARFDYGVSIESALSDDNLIGTVDADFEYAFGAFVRGSYSLSRTFDVYAMAEYAFRRYSLVSEGVRYNEATNNAPAVEIGGRYRLTPNAQIGLGWYQFFDDANSNYEFDSITLSFRYQF